MSDACVEHGVAPPVISVIASWLAQSKIMQKKGTLGTFQQLKLSSPLSPWKRHVTLQCLRSNASLLGPIWEILIFLPLFCRIWLDLYKAEMICKCKHRT